MRSLSWGQGKRGQEADIRRFSRRLEGKEKEAKEDGKTKRKLSKIRSDK